MKNALVLHGNGANAQTNWFPWLKEELEKRSWKVWIPDLPRAEKPNITRYNDFILSNHAWEFNGESVIIGHSSGSVAILGLLQILPENVTVNTCVLVGSFKDDLGRDDLKELFLQPFDFGKIKQRAKKFIFIHSDNDPHCPLEHAQYLSKQLGGELIVLKGQGHFNLEAGEQYRKFPFLLDLLTNASNTK